MKNPFIDILTERFDRDEERLAVAEDVLKMPGPYLISDMLIRAPEEFSDLLSGEVFHWMSLSRGIPVIRDMRRDSRLLGLLFSFRIMQRYCSEMPNMSAICFLERGLLSTK